MAVKPVIHCIGYASGIAAADPTCCMGPLILQPLFTDTMGEALPEFVWDDILYPPPSGRGDDALPAVTQISEQLAELTAGHVSVHEPFLVFGGDHTSAIGAWSGAAHALLAQGGRLGLIWIDAHMDSHTPETTITHNLHGMPLADLLGAGNPSLTHLLDATPKLWPENVCLIGVRDYEPAELEFLQSRGVKIFYMEEVKQRGIETVFQEAILLVTQGTLAYGISLDLDGIDPADAPATGLPVCDGISGAELCQSFRMLHNDKRLLGLEITEFHPTLDQDHKTEKLILDLVAAVYATPVK